MQPPQDSAAQKDLQPHLTALGLTRPVLMHRTDLAHIWSVTRPDGSPAVLKVYHNADMDDEAPGIRLLAAARGQATVKILADRPGALMMERLVGPTLAEMFHLGENAQADALLVQAVGAFHDALPATVPKLPRLDSWFGSLFELEYGPDCPHDLKDAMQRASTLAKMLLSQGHTPRLLHGDVHHNNAILTSDGVKLLDAKGVLGDPAFEMANTFRNPEGAADLICDQRRATALAAAIKRELGIDPARQLGWAAAKCALSIAWNAGETLNQADPERALLSMLLDMVEARL